MCFKALNRSPLVRRTIPPPHAVRELAPPGDLTSISQRPLPFEFRNVEMRYDSYRGLQVRCR